MNGETRVLVTGASGFIASALLRRLTQAGVRSFGTVREIGPSLQQRKLPPEVEIIETGRYRPPTLARALAPVRAHVVVHLASYGVAQQDRDTEDVIEGNVNLVSRLLSATANWPLRKWLHTGSCFEYAPAPLADRLNEQSPVAPATIYGAAKASGVLFGAALAQRICSPFCTLRLFGVYGPGEAETRLIPSLFHRLIHNQTIELTPGLQVRDLLYIDDAVDAYLAAINAPNLQNYQVYNVCSGEPVTIRQVGTSVASAMLKPSGLLRWGALAYRRDEPARLVGDPGKFARATGWRATRSLAAGVAESVAHLTSISSCQNLQSA